MRDVQNESSLAPKRAFVFFCENAALLMKINTYFSAFPIDFYTVYAIIVNELIINWLIFERGNFLSWIKKPTF